MFLIRFDRQDFEKILDGDEKSEAFRKEEKIWKTNTIQKNLKKNYIKNGRKKDTLNQAWTKQKKATV